MGTLKQMQDAASIMAIGVVDFFCGAGGVSAGLRSVKGHARLHIVAGIDNDPYCARTYEQMIGVPCDKTDILELARSKELLASKIESWALDRFDKVLLVGCSPCQGFSAHRKAVMDGSDPRRNLFEAFCQIASVIKPDAILMENVPDLFSVGHWSHFEAGRQRLADAGYQTRSGIYNFAGFGLPQERFRAVVMAFRQPFELPSAPLTPDKYRTVRDAIGHLPPLYAGEADKRDTMHISSRHRQSTLDILRQVPKNGGNRPVGVGPACLDRTRKAHGGYTDVYGRLAWDRPSVTITARCRTPSCGRFAHPEYDRGLTTREAALLQGFPPDYVFCGPFDDGFKQVGNAVSPLVATKLGEFIAAKLTDQEIASFMNGVRPIEVNAPVGPGFAVTINGIKKQRVRLNAA
ncbi:DNA cytosine methyltransferase [Skermanella sp. TT6]|uniref:DNA (cytosine-5-)-methyltransferase n=1 Tax=Skermanella cutis TaxID=2775420 RepID=A0ABX7B636_9PROT|nr:DNA cytosine methyltransferase [Skermanella sp. TT6]QQP89833.1 DNA cytosine methyltransferase [Skermanella sp. TT6]